MRTSTRPPLRTAHSHSHSTSRTLAHASTASRAASAAQALPPSRTALRSPAVSTPTQSPSPSQTQTQTQTELRATSPNYFGLVVDQVTERDSDVGPKDNWSPPTSSIHSFERPSPKHVPLEFNSEYEAFKKQTEHTSFQLGSLNASSTKPFAPRRLSKVSKPASSPRHVPQPSSPRMRSITADAMDVDDRDRRPATDARRSSTAEVASRIVNVESIPRYESPAQMPQTPLPQMPPGISSRLDGNHPRLSLPPQATSTSPVARLRTASVQRAETLPTTLEEAPSLISPSELNDMLTALPSAKYLLLDLRASPQFSSSRIKHALNLCIPTTLLKRPTFNVKKLTDTFAEEPQRARFLSWKRCEYIIVYDATSSTKKDAAAAVNTLKKFTTEGWTGQAYILCGGFRSFAAQFTDMVDTSAASPAESTKKSLSLDAAPSMAAVVGGCAMPTSKAPVNPFFGNIRQNMDLVGGVGQIEIHQPDEFPVASSTVPEWLRQAASPTDRGKLVADKFLQIELEEQSRMQKALSCQVTYNTPGTSHRDDGAVQIAGIEKGGKNRYNNIWPFEHARVKLQGRPDGACDYVNASHIKASRSDRRYIASQGPLPSTFEDFWSVVWDQDVRVIVMLTAESEGGQLKCHPYWAAQTYGPFKLKALSEKKISLEPNKSRHRNSNVKAESGRRRANTSNEAPSITIPSTETPFVILRKFALAHSAHPFEPLREIVQLYYPSWPDFGAPASPVHLLNLVELCSAMRRTTTAPLATKSSDAEDHTNARPILVHCSAGCGRTGTFCTVDTVLDMLKHQRREERSGVDRMDVDVPSSSRNGNHALPPDDYLYDNTIDIVEATVRDFRLQRLSMVQSLRQFVLCYETVLEWLAQHDPARSTRERSGSEAGLATRYELK